MKIIQSIQIKLLLKLFLIIFEGFLRMRINICVVFVESFLEFLPFHLGMFGFETGNVLLELVQVGVIGREVFSDTDRSQ